MRCATGMRAEGSIAPENVRVQFRGADGSEDERLWGEASGEKLAQAAPWRVFRWHRGQRHFSGMYWSATERRHVPYESRLELARLMFADFDPVVRRIAAQPFLLVAEVDGKLRRHVPDYLLLTDHGPVVVDVKPRSRWSDPTVAFTLGWARSVVEAQGWRYEVAGEPSEVELANVRFLAGYRREQLFGTELLAELRAQDLTGATLGEAFRCLPSRSDASVRASVLHLLWRQELLIDIARPLSPARLLRVRT